MPGHRDVAVLPSAHVLSLAGIGLERADPPVVRVEAAEEVVVVVSRSRDAAREVFLERCAADRVPVVRRPSGGGAVGLLVLEANDEGIPVVVFDSGLGQGAEVVSYVASDNRHGGKIAAERLAGLIDGRGKVAIMRGFPSAPNHRERYEAQVAVLRKYPGISIVDGGDDNDDIETAERQAAAVLEANLDLRGYLCCDAAGPIGMAAAIRKAGKVGKIAIVGMDGIRPILEAVKEGVLESSGSTIPAMQGSMSVLMLWQARRR